MMLVHKDRTGHPVGKRFRQTLETHTYSTGHKDTETSGPTEGVETVSRRICRRRQWEKWSDIRRNTGGCVGETERAGTKGHGGQSLVVPSLSCTQMTSQPLPLLTPTPLTTLQVSPEPSEIGPPYCGGLRGCLQAASWVWGELLTLPTARGVGRWGRGGSGGGGRGSTGELPL